MNVYEARAYKEFLNHKIQESKSVKGYKTILARAAGFSPSFLSQVIHGHIELTPEHALKMASFWNLDAFETDYFMLLVDRARAGSVGLRDHVEAKMLKFRAEVLGEKRVSVQ